MKMKDKLVQQYIDKLGVPPCSEKGQVLLDLQMLGVADPSFGAAHTLNLVIHGTEKYAGAEQTVQIQEAIEAQTKALMTDEATAVTELLYGQVAILNAAFNRYMQMATLTTNSNLFITYSEAAMKAQEQARKTLQTIHDIKNPKPKTVFIKNAILQQINQLVTKTEELQKQLEDRPYAKVDFGSTETTERANEIIHISEPSLAELDRSSHRKGKEKSIAKLA
jgi:hypothetical protein